MFLHDDTNGVGFTANQAFRHHVGTIIECSRLTFTDDQRRLLVDKARLLGQRLFEVVTIVRPETILRWQKKLAAMKFDSSKVERKAGRPRVEIDIEMRLAPSLDHFP